MQDSHANSWVNGKPVDSLVVSDRGLAYGHGIFETLLVCDGVAPFLDRHIARAVEGANALAVAFDESLVRQWLATAIQQHQPGSQARIGAQQLVAKVIITAGTGMRGYRAQQPLSPRCIIQTFDYLPDNTQVTGIRLYPCDYRLPDNERLAGIKHLNRLDQVLAASEVDWGQFDDGLVLGAQGEVLETLTRNLFIKLEDGQWVTPALGRAGVAGVMRSYLLDTLFPQAGFDVVVGEVSTADLQCAQEVFACNSVAGISPVLAVGDEQRWVPGSETRQLMALLREHYGCFHS